ncbi:MAG: LamG domain-containing protein [Lachnospiraceae bacterium]|nr:LamG domain-containing protein [Lachnospiraceae bacterium]
MKCKKIISGLLSLSMLATSVFAGDMTTTVKAAELPEAVASYSFNDETLDSNETVPSGNEMIANHTATPYIAGLAGEYTGKISYETGRTGEATDKSIQMNGYGLKLPDSNVGSDFTYSAWFKPTEDFKGFQTVTQFGVAENDNATWLSLARAYTANGATIAGNDFILWGGSFGLDGSNEVHFTMDKNEWSMITITGKGTEISVYKNGEYVGKTTVNAEPLNGDNRSICVGVNNFAGDLIFPGYVDDIYVYDSVLTDAQIRYLYDGKGAEEIFAEAGFTATSSVTMYPGEQRSITVSLPSLVNKADTTITYAPADEKIATVDKNGMITGVKEGSTEVTTTIVLGNTTKTQKTTVNVEAGEGINSELAAEYDLTKIVDGQIKDMSGRGNHATVQGASGITFGTDEEGNNYMQMASNSSYLELPASIMDSLVNKEEFTIETKFAKSSACGENAWLFCLGSNVKDSGTNYMFLSPNFGNLTLRAGIKNDSTEKLFGTSIQPEVDEWYTVNMVFDEGVLKLYWDGVLITGDSGASYIDTGYSIMDDVVTPGTANDILGFIGKSCWKPDKNYQGKIASFKVYNKALSDEEVQSAFAESFAKELDTITDADILGINKDFNNVKYSLNLPTSINEIPLTWESDNEEVLSSKTGAVVNGSEDVTVVLTATLTSGTLKATKEYTVVVKALDTSELEEVIEKAEAACEEEYVIQESTADVKYEIEQARVLLESGVDSQTKVDKAVRKVKNALYNLEYVETYANPFTFIDESKLLTSTEVAVGGTVTVFSVPAEIRDFVTVSYSSSDAAIATVDENGVITGKADGYVRIIATVTAKADGYAVEYQTQIKVGEGAKIENKPVTTPTPIVEKKVITVEATVADTTIVKGQSTQVSVSAPTDAIVTYRAKGAVAVTSTGKVIGKKGGIGTVIVKVNVSGKTVTRRVTVNVGDISGKGTVKVKKSIKLTVKGISGKVKWSVDKKKLATINSKGVLKAKKKGKVVVTAKVGNYTMKKTITIKKK